MCVYLITNTINGKRYVGQTTKSLESRFRHHTKYGNCRALRGAIKKYGKENFIIEAVCEPPTIELMNELEAECIRLYNSLVPNGYNLTEGGRVPRHSLETRQKMRLSHLGKKWPPGTSNLGFWTPEQRNIVAERNRKIRSKLTQDQAEKIRVLYESGDYSQAYLGRLFSIHQTIVSRILLNKSYKN